MEKFLKKNIEIWEPVRLLVLNMSKSIQAIKSSFDNCFFKRKLEKMKKEQTSAFRMAPAKEKEKEKNFEKVKNRLGLWAKPEKQKNINARILNVFLKLKQSGNECVTKKNIQNQLPNISTFENNFNQMKMITKHNHGKIFEETNGYIEIWEPVRLLVSKYEQEVFKQ